MGIQQGRYPHPSSCPLFFPFYFSFLLPLSPPHFCLPLSLSESLCTSLYLPQSVCPSPFLSLSLSLSIRLSLSPSAWLHLVSILKCIYPSCSAALPLSPSVCLSCRICFRILFLTSFTLLRSPFPSVFTRVFALLFPVIPLFSPFPPLIPGFLTLPLLRSPLSPFPPFFRFDYSVFPLPPHVWGLGESQRCSTNQLP